MAEQERSSCTVMCKSRPWQKISLNTETLVVPLFGNAMCTLSHINDRKLTVLIIRKNIESLYLVLCQALSER